MHQKCHKISVSRLDYSKIYQGKPLKICHTTIMDAASVTTARAPQVRIHPQPRHDGAVESFEATLLLQARLQLRLAAFPRKRIQESWKETPVVTGRISASPRHPTSSKEKLKEPWRNLTSIPYQYNRIYVSHLYDKENMYHMSYIVFLSWMSCIT